MQLGLVGAFGFGVLLVASSPVLEGLGVTSFSDGEGSRYSIWQMTMQAIEDHWIFGTGLGTYESVIPLYENPETVTATFVAKAHNDYLQLVMDTGIFGLAFIGGCMFWFGQRFFNVWGKGRGGTTEALRKFAFISLLAVALHSIVDYPARTPAIAAILGLCLALISISDGRPKGQSSKRRSSGDSNTKRVVL
jgi:O-antigen ligase